MMQALAYKGICEAKIPEPDKKTTQMLTITCHAVKDITSVYPDDNEVWKSDLAPRLQQSVPHLHMEITA